MRATHREQLQKLSVEELQQYKAKLKTRIDDLKFFNLDLGRENIRLTETYRMVRQKAENIQKSGKNIKIVKPSQRKTNEDTVNDNRQNLQQPNENHPNKAPPVKKSKGFNFDDIYYKSKNKLSGWIPNWGTSSKDPQPQPEISVEEAVQRGLLVPYEDANRPGHIYYAPPPQQNIYPNPNKPNPVPPSFRQTHNGVTYFEKEFLPKDAVSVIQVQKDQNEAQNRQIEHIVKCTEEVSSESTQNAYQPLYRHGMQKETELNSEQPPYQKLEQRQQPTSSHQYRGMQNPTMQQRQQYGQHPQQRHPQVFLKHHGSTQVNAIGSKKVTRNNFQFNDLPGLGWKKLKGMFSYGSKSKAEKSQTVPQNQSSPMESIIPQVDHQYARNTDAYDINIVTDIVKQKERKKIFGEGLQKRMQPPSLSQSSTYSVGRQESKVQKNINDKSQQSQRESQSSNQVQKQPKEPSDKQAPDEPTKQADEKSIPQQLQKPSEEKPKSSEAQ